MIVEHNDQLRVTSNNIRNDKIEIHIKNIFIYCHVDDYFAFAQHLSRTPNNNEEEQGEFGYLRTGWIFSSPSGDVDDPSYMIVRSTNRNSDRPVPLFSGRLDFRRQDVSPEQVRCELRFTLEFNPTRMFVHQNLLRNNNSVTSLAEPITITHSPNPYLNGRLYRVRGDEFTLDGNDNCIMLPAWMRYCTRENWLNFLDATLEQTVQAYFEEVRRAYIETARNNNVRISFDAPNYSMRQIESYCEMRPPPNINSIDYLYNLLPCFRRYANHVITEYPTPVSVEQNRISPVITLVVGSNREMVIYAKTLNRVRFEFRQYRDGINGRRSSYDLPEISEHMVRQTSPAVRQINNLLQWIQGETSRPRRPVRTPHLLYSQIYRHSSSPSVAEAIITSLIRRGNVTPSGVRELSATIRKLVRYNVLRRTPNTAAGSNLTYTVAPHFTATLEYFQNSLNPNNRESD